VLPGSYIRPQRALAAEARAYERSVAELDTRARNERAAATTQGGDSEPQDASELDELSEVNEDLDVD
jgi:hypothetical protein